MLFKFSWLAPYPIAGTGGVGESAFGEDIDSNQLQTDLEQLHNNGIGAIVSLTENPLDRNIVQAKGLRYLHIPIADMCPPTLDDVFAFIEFAGEAAKEKRKILVHCGAGMGRTGTMLACYLVNDGFDAGRAIEQTRRQRPGSVETEEQEQLVYLYANCSSNGLV
ncbi:MAG: protein phosphatase [Candidatus Latescibacteria bacterium]|nr:protein phosphatase [Candidatus Latescibacterota bacterium]